MLTIAVLFGGVSTEHEVSIITGVQILNVLDKSKYKVIPIYITKDGKWVKGDESFYKAETFRNFEKAIEKQEFKFISPDPLINYLVDKPQGYTFLKPLVKEQIDVVFPAFHGRIGEDGSIQGLLEMANIAYVGCGVTAAAIGMDKMLSKRVAQSINIPVLPANWINNKDNWKIVKEGLKYPIYVKPVHLGSSIGIKRVNNDEELKEALDVSFFYDTKVIVEEGIKDAKEVNISLLGNNPYKISVCEQPVSSSDTLSFEDKYIAGSGPSKGMATLKRIIPAPIKKTTEQKIQDYAVRFFSEIGGEGIVRMDFLLSKDEKHVYLNEINTMPGSISFYLWEKNGLKMQELIDELIGLAIARQKKKEKLNTTFKSNILEGFGGAKGKA